MIRAIGFTLLATAALVPALLRESNSERLTNRGIAAFRQEKYEEAVRHFQAAEKIESTAQKKFNEGTARVAAGDFVPGSTLLTDAAADPKLRADSLFNRGTSALTAGALEQAVGDFEQVLRLDPSRLDAKRNLEIALRRKQKEKADSPDRSEGKGEQEQQQSGEQKPSDDPQQQKGQPKGEQDIDQILRAVEQQEREELSRMRRNRAERRRVGW